MRASNFSSCTCSHYLWLVSFGVCLVFLATWSMQHARNDYSVTTAYRNQESVRVISKGPGDPPVLAYWIFGSSGEGKRILRLLKAVYHPRNRYLLQLNAGSGSRDYREKVELALSVRSEKLFEAFGNVDVVGRGYAFDDEGLGASALAATLHAAALLLKIGADWDWFITLSASDYPLMTQDDLLHALTPFPRDLNFINYTKNSGWKKKQNINQITVDEHLQMKEKNMPIFYAVETRTTPDAFTMFGGSPWMILSRAFIEHCVKGWDNFPRKLMIYYSNMPFPLESYFHTVLCNSPDFHNTTVSNDLRYTIWESTDNNFGKTLTLDLSHYHNLTSSKAVFARPFKNDDPLLEKLDKDVLKRLPAGIVPGKWCLQRARNESLGHSKAQEEEDFCSSRGDIDAVKPGSYGLRLGKYLSKLAAEKRLVTNQCQLPPRK